MEGAKMTNLLQGAPFVHFLKLLRLADRHLFNTTQGRFGFTSRGVRPGDLVAVLNGSQTPHVIRKVDDRNGEKRYMFVGDAYVDGLMYDEARQLDIEERDIVFI
jgi:hypothetical protein